MRTIMEKTSDKELRETLLRHLQWVPEITSPDINVSARDGAVTLTGFVHSYPEKFAAEKAVKSVYGVLAVANDIEVKPAVRTDPEIARDILHALKLDATVPDDRIRISVRNAFVTLEGTTDWHYQRAAAESCARNVSGVGGVANKIEVKPKVSTVEVKAKIEGALRRSAEVDARRITVSVEDGAVALSGNVRSWSEKEEAVRAAWAAPGVNRVVDHIAVVS